MRQRLIALLTAAALACAGAACSSTKSSVVDEGESAAPSLLIVNGRVFGAVGADAVLIAGHHIRAVGSTERLAVLAPADILRLDARGGWIVPGFNDAHSHLRSGGQALGELSLDGMTTLDQVLAAVKSYATTHPTRPWLTGRGWLYDIVPQGSFPTRQQLDAVVADRPVVLEAYDGHSVWANSQALKLAQIDARSVDPADGKIVRDADGKTPAGTLLENAGAPLYDAMPEPDRATQRAILQAALEHYLKLGITSVEDFEHDPIAFELYAELASQSALPIRVSVSLPIEGNLDTYELLRQKYATPFLRFGHVKGFVDGVVESKTAYMVSPYDFSGERGKPLIPPDRLFALVAAAHQRNFRVALHCVGDGAVRLALDAYERAQASKHKPTLRHRIEHIEVVHPDDVPRFAALDVIASMMPYHANPGGADPDAGVWSQNLGRDRLRHSFAWHDLLQAGAVLAFGSDWPVMSADPLWGLAVATTRQDERGFPPGGWNAQQAISASAALSAYTLGSAISINRQHELGRLAPGMLADVVVLAPEVDIEKPSTLWRGERVAAVIVDGQLRLGPTTRSGTLPATTTTQPASAPVR